MSERSELELSIKENGLDSLTHAIDHYLEEQPSTYLKYVILHTVHAVELLLKARLESINPDLLYGPQIRRPPTDDSITINFFEALEQLKIHGVRLDPQEVTDLKALRKFRHRIEHRRLTATRQEVENFVGQAMRFLDRFTMEELGLNLRERLDPITYDKLIELLHGFEEAVARAEHEMEEFYGLDRDGVPIADRVECPICGNFTVVHPDRRFDFGVAQCFMPGCRVSLYTDSCESCGQGIASSTPLEIDDVLACDDCLHRWMDES